ncbi:hypothetical protein Pcinc_024762 [Petrolisthes cinctipes]|uniref:Uncharacterized protein n=1 Tax=Petrolisthes cinctipes TaxID=88211 RepID=A0AAE1KAD1_PETCI|nr:hypothetical protein Pcinc_024762 [Petrolisthes cinctipes]
MSGEGFDHRAVLRWSSYVLRGRVTPADTDVGSFITQCVYVAGQTSRRTDGPGVSRARSTGQGGDRIGCATLTYY